jgi:hypothetical protein
MLSQISGPPTPDPSHRKSGLPDVRTMMRNPGRPGFRGEGEHICTMEAVACSITTFALPGGEPPSVAAGRGLELMSALPRRAS